MLGPNKDFLDIILEAKIQDEQKISLVTNLTNSMQNVSKVVLYLTLKDVNYRIIIIYKTYHILLSIFYQIKLHMLY